ncbi:MAG TPA: iron-sulfur cluster assembly scaffold protein [Croceibacterium sp.]|nr:iron-sulfur cluster assembly scaffold protein [Croceibacterium sp.]
MSAARLYTPELLALAVELASYPPLEPAAARGEARSPTCGSTLAVDLELDGAGRIAGLGMRVRACAVGQAAAAIFARHARGRGQAEIGEALARMEAWLAHEGAQPAWPDLALIAPARAYPARHGAILLPWKAALAALSTTAPAG